MFTKLYRFRSTDVYTIYIIYNGGRFVESKFCWEDFRILFMSRINTRPNKNNTRSTPYILLYLRAIGNLRFSKHFHETRVCKQECENSPLIQYIMRIDVHITLCTRQYTFSRQCVYKMNLLRPSLNIIYSFSARPLVIFYLFD